MNRPGRTLDASCHSATVAGMTLLDRRAQVLATVLAALAGFVDAVGFMATGGFFVSFMSGNSTRLGVGVAIETGAVLVAGVLVLAFTAGVVAGALVGHVAGRRRRTAVLLLVAGVLALAAALAQPGAVPGAFLLVAFAMGAENMVFQRNGDVSFGLTYMTGTLVKIGQRVATALTGGDRWGWAPFLMLWLGLVAGGIAGALTYARIGSDGLWIAAAVAALVAAALALTPKEKELTPPA
jgi:uncharacterized membrane protein YoaK (UPF0700 family)